MLHHINEESYDHAKKHNHLETMTDALEAQRVSLRNRSNGHLKRSHLGSILHFVSYTAIFVGGTVSLSLLNDKFFATEKKVSLRMPQVHASSYGGGGRGASKKKDSPYLLSSSSDGMKTAFDMLSAINENGLLKEEKRLEISASSSYIRSSCAITLPQAEEISRQMEVLLSNGFQSKNIEITIFFSNVKQDKFSSWLQKKEAYRLRQEQNKLNLLDIVPSSPPYNDERQLLFACKAMKIFFHIRDRLRLPSLFFRVSYSEEATLVDEPQMRLQFRALLERTRFAN